MGSTNRMHTSRQDERDHKELSDRLLDGPALDYIEAVSMFFGNKGKGDQYYLVWTKRELPANIREQLPDEYNGLRIEYVVGKTNYLKSA